MRKALLFGLLCFSSLVMAQVNPSAISHRKYTQSFAKGTWLVGAQGGSSAGLVLGKNLSLQAFGGYFITNQVLLGLSGSRSQEDAVDFRGVFTAVGPMVRLQLTRTRISPFIAVSYQAGWENFTGGHVLTAANATTTPTGQIIPNGPGIYYTASAQSHVYYSRSLEAGLSVGVIPSLRFDLLLNWKDQVASIDASVHSINIFSQLQFGVNYLLGR